MRYTAISPSLPAKEVDVQWIIYSACQKVERRQFSIRDSREKLAKRRVETAGDYLCGAC
jgi:uncharacterized protein YjaG (DUF416 family)